VDKKVWMKWSSLLRILYEKLTTISINWFNLLLIWDHQLRRRVARKDNRVGWDEDWNVEKKKWNKFLGTNFLGFGVFTSNNQTSN